MLTSNLYEVSIVIVCSSVFLYLIDRYLLTYNIVIKKVKGIGAGAPFERDKGPGPRGDAADIFPLFVPSSIALYATRPTFDTNTHKLLYYTTPIGMIFCQLKTCFGQWVVLEA